MFQFCTQRGSIYILRVKGELGENEESASSATSKFPIRHFCTEQTAEQSLIYLKELSVARCKSQVAPARCSQSDHLTPPKGVSRYHRGDNGAPLRRGACQAHLPRPRRVDEAQYLAEGARHAHRPSHSRLGGGDWGGRPWQLRLGSALRVLACESRGPVPTISELADPRQVTVRSEAPIPFCKTKRPQDSDPPRCYLPAEVLLL